MTHSGGKPHDVGDQGQRYEVTYLNSAGERKVCGWASTLHGASRMASAIDKHPTWNSPQVRDRSIEAEEVKGPS